MCFSGYKPAQEMSLGQLSECENFRQAFQQWPNISNMVAKKDHPSRNVDQEKVSVPHTVREACDLIRRFVHQHKQFVSESLRTAGRSRLGRLVLRLPGVESRSGSGAGCVTEEATDVDLEMTQQLAMSSLPEGRDALVLATASAVVSHLTAGHYDSACRSADITLIFVGAHDELGSNLLRVVDFVDAQIRTKPNSSQQNPAGLPVIDETRLSHCKLNIPTCLSEMLCADVEAADLPNDRFKRDFFDRDVPVVLRNLATDWPAFTAWHDLNAMTAKHGHRVVPVERVSRSRASGRTMREEFQSLEGVFRAMARDLNDTKTIQSKQQQQQDDMHQQVEKETQKKEGVLEEEEEEESVYLAQHPLFDYIPEMRSDVHIPRFVEAGGKGLSADVVNVWMGTAGSGSKLHFDSADNILVQVTGKKTVVLIHPKYSNALGVQPSNPNISPISPLHCETEHPKFANTVRGATVQLNAGDGLFIPAQHWHWVQADTPSMSVNFWF